MKQIYTQQAIIRVWRNLKVLGKVPTSHFGHASVTVTGNRVAGTPGQRPNTQNISFWPKDGAGFHNAFKDIPGAPSSSTLGDRIDEMNVLTALRLEVGYCQTEGLDYPQEWDLVLRNFGKKPLSQPRAGQKRLVHPGTNQVRLSDELFFEIADGRKVFAPLYSQSAQAKFYLPGLCAEGRNWGLNTNRMSKWWIEFQKTNPPYRAFSPKQNCVGIVLEALREGGADSLVPVPKIHSYGEPVQVEQYAKALEEEFRQLERQTAVLQLEIQSKYSAMKPVPVSELMDGLWFTPHWKSASALGVMYRRSALIQEIDDLLERFFRLTWKYAYLEKFDLLVRLFRAVVKHREDKSDSKRSEAVAQLGSQILRLLAKRGFYDGFRPA